MLDHEKQQIEQMNRDNLELRQRLARAERSLTLAGYTYHGGELWKPPLGPRPDFNKVALTVNEAIRTMWPSLPEALQALVNEAERSAADAKKGRFNSSHEAYGVIAEEVAELLDAIRTNDPVQIHHEAMQVGAAATLFAAQLEEENRG